MFPARNSRVANSQQVDPPGDRVAQRCARQISAACMKSGIPGVRAWPSNYMTRYQLRTSARRYSGSVSMSLPGPHVIPRKVQLWGERLATIPRLENTSAASIISVPELMLRARDLASSSFLPMEIFLLAAAIFLLMSLPIALLTKLLEARFPRGQAPA